MTTGTVTDCRSKFYDDGGPTTNYASILNTVVTKTLTIFAGGPITMTFSPILGQTEIKVGDFIAFFDGPNAQSPPIGAPYTFIDNVTNFLPNIVAPSGSLTVVWTENGNSAGIGWNGGWFALAPDPIAPTASISPVPSCNTSVITLTTSQGIMCDSLKPNYFNISGPVTPIISNIIPLPCSNGTTSVFQIQFSPPLNQNCNYQVTSTLFRKNKCDSVYIYPNIINTFSIGNCPIQGSINVTSSNTVCAYSCTASIFAVIPSSVCLNFNYNWNPPLPNSPGPHAVCPTITTVYNCTVTEQTTLTQTVLTRTIVVINPQIVPLANPTICTSSSSFNFTGTPSGGTWIGAGITNTALGTFCPGCTGAGVKTVTYQVGNCFATYQFTTVLASANNDDAACLNGPTFTVSGGSPGGGVWSGPHVTPLGVFTPTQLGSFVLTYSVGPCSDTKVVNVVPAIVTPTAVIDICKSRWFVYFSASEFSITPFGGRYSKVGPGITNNVLGTFSPSLAGVGLHVITYSLATGCSQTFTVNVIDIDVTPNTATTCPTHAPFLLSTIPSTTIPAGGTWSCSALGAIQNSTTGMYNPSATSVISHTDILIYRAPNGCPDTIVMKALKTDMVRDTVFFCVNSPSLQLSNNFITFSYSPAGGTFTGTGVTFNSGNYWFSPATASVGIHTVYYDNNTCRDSVKMIVYPSIVSVPDVTLCSTHPTLMIVNPPLPFGTTWSGSGIITPSLGVFNPSVVPSGVTYTFTFTNRGGCGTGNVKIHVYQFQPATFGNLNNVYCFTNQNVLFTTSPLNGSLTAASTITNNTFNPSIVGAGTHSLTYEYGVGACLTSTTIAVTVHPQLTTSTSISAPTICLGESSKLNVLAAGGLPTVMQYTYAWTSSLTNQPNQNVVPNGTIVYTVITTDGCSDPVTDTFRVNVHPKYYPAFVSTPKQCYGVIGTTTINIIPNGSYSYTWNTQPVQTSSVLTGESGKNYIVRIKNTVSGCIRDTSVMIPGYGAIKALFSPNPNLSCIPFEDNLVTFLDLSNGALSGTWSFNGATQSYTPGVAVPYLFNNPGTYNVRLDVVNDGNCPSSYELSICVLESTEIFLPDIFSPNKDGSNDVLYLRGNGVKEMKFQLYDRWGNKVFESVDVNFGWDGTYKGKDSEPGVYAYYIDVTLFNDKKITKKGDITLVR